MLTRLCVARSGSPAARRPSSWRPPPRSPPPCPGSATACRCSYESRTCQHQPGGRAFNQLRNLARRTGHDPAEYLTIYALEGFLTRLAASDQSGAFVLKGGVLMAAYASRRPTRDIDLAAIRVDADIDDLTARIRTILAVPADDGLVFDPAALAVQPIRETSSCPGLRIKMTAQLASTAPASRVTESRSRKRSRSGRSTSGGSVRSMHGSRGSMQDRPPAAKPGPSLGSSEFTPSARGRP